MADIKDAVMAVLERLAAAPVDAPDGSRWMIVPGQQPRCIGVQRREVVTWHPASLDAFVALLGAADPAREAIVWVDAPAGSSCATVSARISETTGLVWSVAPSDAAVRWWSRRSASHADVMASLLEARADWGADADADADAEHALALSALARVAASVQAGGESQVDERGRVVTQATRTEARGTELPVFRLHAPLFAGGAEVDWFLVFEVRAGDKRPTLAWSVPGAAAVRRRAVDLLVEQVRAAVGGLVVLGAMRRLVPISPIGLVDVWPT